ncbi:fibroblast growth factor [Spodoptera frugiperda multiple nucleopolyhedrovirus]|uniref:Fibroblast growth factor n=2 Tax=Spodoptera frugiperda nuclear polyhedrosis virus TaxID=10455 RepID=A1YJ27_NPVSF|nr:fibroblast growth factor [Spodoptera frugiperda multiple nucleopolyhedrovirus]ABM45747.1 fibroblast growth factor [Spodoptera frugiperda multiple nucleopolyhedrovirus]
MFVKVISILLLVATIASGLAIDTTAKNNDSVVAVVKKNTTDSNKNSTSTSSKTSSPTLLSINDTLTGTQNNIVLYFNHYLLRMNLVGDIDGTKLENSNDTVFHRIAQPNRKILLRSSAHCSFLCINECGYVFSSKTPTFECLWNEYYDSFRNRFLIKQFENNRTAYLAIDAAGKTHRVLLLKKEKLLDDFESAHMFLKNSTRHFKRCKSYSSKKLTYMPPKTCKNPPRVKKLQKLEEGSSSSTVKKIPDMSMIIDEMYDEIMNNSDVIILTNSSELSSTKNLNNSVVVNATIVDRMKHEITNEVPDVVYLDSSKVNKTKEGAIPKNFYYHDEEFSIRTLDDDRTEHVETVVSKLVAAKNITINIHPFMFFHQTILRYCMSYV